MKTFTRALLIFLALALSGAAVRYLYVRIADAPEDKLCIGVTAGPHAEIMTFVHRLMQKNGVKGVLKVQEFNDFILPNAALDEGALDINCYQHKPFLDEQIHSRGYKNIEILGTTILLPMGLYSQKYTRIEKIPSSARIALPNDPTNEGRALKLLEDESLIALNPDAGMLATVVDIKSNPKKFQFIEIEAPQLPRILDDVDVAIINTDWVLVSGMTQRPLVTEAIEHNPYANILAVNKNSRKQRKDAIERFLLYYYSEETKTFIKEHYNGRILTCW